MGFKKYIYWICAVVFLQIAGAIKNYQDEKNTISEEERRGAESATKDQYTRGTRESAPQTGHRFYLPPVYESSDYGHTSSGNYGHTSSGGYAHPSSYGHTAPTYYFSSGSGSVAHQSPQPSFGSFGSYPSHSPGPTTGHGVGHPQSGSHFGHSSSHSALALKGILIPLAGIALLGAAAALSTNPVLLQLGVLNGRRRRRSLRSNEDVYPVNPHVKPDNVS